MPSQALTQSQFSPDHSASQARLLCHSTQNLLKAALTAALLLSLLVAQLPALRMWQSTVKMTRERGDASHLFEACMAARLHAHADGVQAEQGVSQVGRPLLRLGARKLQNRQRLPKRLQLVCPAQSATATSAQFARLGQPHDTPALTLFSIRITYL